MDISRLEAALEGIGENVGPSVEGINNKLGSLNTDMPDYIVAVMAAMLEAGDRANPTPEIVTSFLSSPGPKPHLYARRARDLFLAAMEANVELDADHVRVVPGWHRPMTPAEYAAAREREERGEDL